MKMTKIVTTLGPATKSKEKIKALIAEGANVLRLNFSHGTHDYHQETINMINEVRKEISHPVAIMLDTKGPEIRTHKMENDSIFLEKGKEIIVSTKECVGNTSKISVTHAGIVKDVKKGDTILIDDGLIGLTVLSVSSDEIKCMINNSAKVGTYKGVNLPNSNVSLPALADKDQKDLLFGIKNDVDFVAASFIRTAKDVDDIRAFLTKNGGSEIKIISKIENQQGIDNFDEILKTTDGVMVARGDLGVEIPIEQLPFRQKEMIEKCNIAAKYVITATHMLESMVVNPRPTRAEIGDVANAVCDGSDATMLSGETAKGEYPVEAVQTMAKIAKTADSHNYAYVEYETTTLAEAITVGCVEAAELAEAKVIVATSKSGKAIARIRRCFPSMPILALTPEQKTANQLCVVKGAVPVLIKATDVNPESIEAFSTKIILEMKLAKKGDKVAILSAAKPFSSDTTNSFTIITL